MKKVIGLLLLVWLLIGTFAAYQRDYFSDAETNCADAGTIALNIVAGPLNYMGVDPEVDECPDADIPEPSEDES